MLQVIFRIRIKMLKPTGRNFSLLLIVMWAIVALVNVAQEPYKETRQSERPIIAYRVWLELAQQDFLVASALIVSLAW